MSNCCIDPSSLMLSEDELARVASQLQQFADATTTLNALVASVTVKVRIVTPASIRHGFDQRLGVHLAVRYEAGYNIVRDVEGSSLNSADIECQIQALCTRNLASAGGKQATILNEWILQDLANGLPADIVEAINRANRGLLTGIKLTTNQPTVFVALSYALNGVREIRTGIDGHAPDGMKLVGGIEFPGILVKRESSIPVLEAVIDAFSVA